MLIRIVQVVREEQRANIDKGCMRRQEKRRVNDMGRRVYRRKSGS